MRLHSQMRMGEGAPKYGAPKNPYGSQSCQAESWTGRDSQPFPACTLYNYVYIYIYIYTHTRCIMCIHIYIYIYICIIIYSCIYIYTYIHREREIEKERGAHPPSPSRRSPRRARDDPDNKLIRIIIRMIAIRSPVLLAGRRGNLPPQLAREVLSHGRLAPAGAYLYKYVYVCIYIYIYIYTHTYCLV